ncbi:hypothetical protein KP509_08G005800 [Ceratopteris richardii]|uniref:Metallo-beta-lactamase domain-containing protein n=1 Tax=Ceratopteris richardii TaxID=49495 RepID=A0A8T2U5I8_CERRI|nr:hypothetical protein KP509_08G005800 [Ceratopteris richardii]
MATFTCLRSLQLRSYELSNSLPPSNCSARAPLSSNITFNWSTKRLSTTMRAVESANAAAAAAGLEQNLTNKDCLGLQLTFLEGNSWLWNVRGTQILVDPVLVGNLDFGIPLLYDASKKTLKEFKLEDLPQLDLLLITQNFDDHCHVNTLQPLSKIIPDLQVISTPNAEPTLTKLFKKVIYLEPGQSTTYKSKNGSEIVIRASAGPTLGPPWQRPENGYFVDVKDPSFSLYYEPHCVFDRMAMSSEQADVVITPVIKQVLPFYTLVSGQGDAVDLVKLLKARFVVPLQNGDLDSKGILAKIVSRVGTVEEFKDLLEAAEESHVQILEAKPGVPLDVPLAMGS